MSQPTTSREALIAEALGDMLRLVDRIEADLGELAAVGLQQVLADPHFRGDLAHRNGGCRSRDLEISRK